MTFQGPDRVRTIGQPNKFAVSMPLFNADRLAGLKDMIANNTLDFRMKQKWDAILLVDNTYQPQGPFNPFDLPPYYDDPEANNALTKIINDDGTRAVDLGIRWRVLGNIADAQAVARILTPWTNVQNISNDGDTRLVWCDRWPMFMQAAQLISDSSAYTSTLKSGMEGQTRRGLVYSTAHVQTENRAMWGCMMEVAAAAFLNDRAVFDRAIKRWREIFEHDIKGNIPVGEVLRESNGLYYCNFLLNAMTQTAEIARFNGEWLYDFKTSDGSTYKGLWDVVAGWTANPSTYPYWPGTSTPRIQAHVDPLHALWPSANSQALINTYTTTQDYYGYRQGMLAWRFRPLYG